MKLADISLVHNYNNNLNKKDEAAIHIRIYLNSKRKLLPTGVHVKPEEWDPGKMQVKARPDKDTLNIRLRDALRKYQDRQDYLYKRSRTITIDSILSVREQEMKGEKSFIEFCRKEIEERAGITPSTKKHHRTYLTRLTEFKGEIYFSEIDFTLLNDYERFLLNYEFKVGEETRKLKLTRVFKYIKFFRTYLNLAINKDLFEETLSPFRLRKFDTSKYTNAERQASKRRTYLERSEIKRIENLFFKGSAAYLNEIKEFFLFQCYTGLAFNDMIRIKKKQISHEIGINADDKKQRKGYHIALDRGKTNEPFYLPVYLLGDEAIRILDKRRKTKGLYLFEAHSVQHINRELKTIAKAAGIDKNVTSHVGRHSCAMLLRSRGVPLDVIQRIMGHSDFKSTLLYTNIDRGIIREALIKASLN